MVASPHKVDDPSINLDSSTSTAGDIEKAPSTAEAPSLHHIQSHYSHHDLHGAACHHTEADADQYERFSERRKVVITLILSLCGFLSPISSTSILSAVPEVAAEYQTTGSIINLSNALYLIAMGISPCLWGPLSQVYGRRWVGLLTRTVSWHLLTHRLQICITTAVLFFAFSIGTALAPNLASYFVFRILTALQGTSFLIVGTSCLGDIYPPTKRATALGLFLSGTLIGPAFGPCIGGVQVTFASWRTIFWLQTALGGLATILVFFLLPETIPKKKIDDLADLNPKEKFKTIVGLTNPGRVVVLVLTHPNLMATAMASSSLVWNMYSLLTPIRYVLNPRFNLTSPIQSGLFYIAPGIGYLCGTFVGGRWADHTVKKWIRKRGRRVPEDRLKSCLVFMGAVIPGCILIYGWTLDRAVGGIPVPVLAMFVQGVAQLFCFPSLNTYCLDVMQSKGRSAEVVAGNYMVRYLFGAAGSAAVLPAIEKIGVGWFSTLSCAFLIFSTGLVFLTTVYGERWRRKIDEMHES